MIDRKLTDLKILIDEETVQAGVQKLADEINATLPLDEPLYIICVLKGSIMFYADLARRLKMPTQMEFIRLSSYGDDEKSSGRMKTIDLNLPILQDKNILLVEDIVDTGHTAKFLIDFINLNFKPKTFKFCSLLDKKCKREVEIDPDYFCFEVDDKFLVGYGLDYDGYYRNLPYIGYVE